MIDKVGCEGLLVQVVAWVKSCFERDLADKFKPDSRNSDDGRCLLSLSKMTNTCAKTKREQKQKAGDEMLGEKN